MSKPENVEVHHVWTDTQGTANDEAFIDKLIWYKGNYYSAQPLNARDSLKPRPASFKYSAVERRIRRDWYSVERHVKIVSEVSRQGKMWQISNEKVNETDPYWGNGYFSGDDAACAYALAQAQKPKRIIEIGVGNSTKFFRRAISDAGLDTRIVCIDPYPRADVGGVADEVVAESVLDVDLSIFDQLEEGDFLFWDGSHVVMNGSDVVRLFLEVLPRLKRGVILHIHDISMPFEGTHIPSVGDVSYSEQYMLGTYLLNNDRVEVMLPVNMLVQEGIFNMWGRSFWIRT